MHDIHKPSAGYRGQECIPPDLGCQTGLNEAARSRVMNAAKDVV